MSEKTSGGMLRLQLVKSPIGYSQRHKKTLRALGLRRMNASVTLADTPQLRGMMAKVGFLLKVEEQ